MGRMRPSQATAEERTSERAIAARSRSLRNSFIGLAAFFALVVGLLFAVPGLRSAGDHITDANVPWVAGGIALEILSCGGYVVLFGLVFGKLAGRLTWRLSLSELAANSLVSVSGLAGIALGAWVLRAKGVTLARVAQLSIVFFMLTSAVNVAAVVVIGLPMWVGLLPGSRNELLTLLPAAASVATIAGIIAVAARTRRAVQSGQLQRGRAAVALRTLSVGVIEALELIASGDWRLLGSLFYWLFDNLALYACVAAFANAPSFWVVAMAYLIGMLANSIPVPAGLVAVEGGLVGMLLLFGVRPASQVLAAVLIYRAISLWVPAVIGSFAFLSLRRQFVKPAPAVSA
jgi:uncharacterized membrane protein YbhN (UPF0104 family)